MPVFFKFVAFLINEDLFTIFEIITINIFLHNKLFNADITCSLKNLSLTKKYLSKVCPQTRSEAFSCRFCAPYLNLETSCGTIFSTVRFWNLHNNVSSDSVIVQEVGEEGINVAIDGGETIFATSDNVCSLVFFVVEIMIISIPRFTDGFAIFPMN